MTEWLHWCIDPEEGTYESKPNPEPKTRWVYFLLDEDRGFIKVGYSQDPTGRVKRLATGSGSQMKLLACIEGTRDLETQLHRQFKPYRIKGEWFRAEPVMHFLAKQFDLQLSALPNVTL